MSLEEVDAIALTSSDGDEARYAAEQLQNFLLESTGRELPILMVDYLSELSGKRCIVLGRTLSPDYDGLTTDTGYKWRLDRKNLYIYGRTQYGTLNGVLAFMQEYLGLDFFSDTVYNINSVATFTVEIAAQKTFNPSIDYNWADGGLLMTKFWASYAKDADYARRLGFQQSVYVSGAEWHNFTTLISQEKYASAHPDWFRNETDANNNAFVMLDLSYNDFEMCETVADELLSKIISEANSGNYRNRTYYTFSAPDNAGWSTSATAQALKAKYGTDSAEYIIFMNKVADFLEQKLAAARSNGQIDDREITLLLLAYNNTLEAPSYEKADSTQITYSEFVSSMSLKRDSDSFVKLSVMYAPIQMSYQQAITDDTYYNYTREGVTNKYYADNMLVWKGLAPDEIIFWNYSAYYTNYFTPIDTISNLRVTYQFCAENGVTTMYDGGQLGDDVSTNFEALKVYLKGKVAQNAYMTDEEFDAIIENFCNAYYGSGGTYMKQLLKAIMDWYPTVTSRSTNVAGAGHGGSWLANIKECWDDGHTILWKTTYDSRKMKTWYGYVTSALNAVENDGSLTTEQKQIYEDRINVEGISIRFMLAFTYADTTYGDVNSIISDAKALGIDYYAEGKHIENLGDVWTEYNK